MSTIEVETSTFKVCREARLTKISGINIFKGIKTYE
ncbi:MAG: hypothetical protein K0S24_2575 [Sphingobacterium sp.]|jgi:hypothetical protein|nr:hypothetical protein [Sphingobacterium sp.]